MKKITIASLLLAFTFAASTVNAQSVFPNSGAQKWSLGLRIGPDFMLSDNNETAPMTIGFGLQAKYSISHTFGLRFVGEMVNYEGERTYDDNTPGSNFILKGSYMELSLQPVFTWGNISHLKTRKTQLFGYTGLGIAMGNSEITYTSLVPSTAPALGPAGNDTMFVFMPVGFGAKYKMSPKIDLGIDVGFKFYFTDIMDGTNPQEYGNKNNDIATSIRLFGAYKLGAKKGGDNTESHRDWINPLEGIYGTLAQHQEKIDELSKDDDGDGVANIFDQDNETPEGATVNTHGVEVDTDGDGVKDSQDEENNTPAGAVVDASGKGVDSDNDGVYDGIDVENNTPSDMLVNHQGIAIMKKELAGKVGEGATLLPAIFFASNNSTLSASNIQDLLPLATYLKENPSVKLTIIGHCDYTGSEKYNEQLGMKRAEAVKQALIDLGISADRLSTETKGETAPVIDKKTSTARALNRRVQFMITQ